MQPSLRTQASHFDIDKERQFTIRHRTASVDKRDHRTRRGRSCHDEQGSGERRLQATYVDVHGFILLLSP
ncbi:hypothetical protein SN15_15110 [Stenotrophomonas maltophilia]|nr:hypothetical protein SN15_15110 [Stenotrophomonas maltophilia]